MQSYYIGTTSKVAKRKRQSSYHLSLSLHLKCLRPSLRWIGFQVYSVCEVTKSNCDKV